MTKYYKCNSCEWVGHTPKKKSKKKVAFLACPDCENIVHPHYIPLNRKIGRCSCCGHGGNFSLKVYNHDIVRTCPICDEEFSIDHMKVITEGKL